MVHSSLRLPLVQQGRPLHEHSESPWRRPLSSWWFFYRFTERPFLSICGLLRFLHFRRTSSIFPLNRCEVEELFDRKAQHFPSFELINNGVPK